MISSSMVVLLFILHKGITCGHRIACMAYTKCQYLTACRTESPELMKTRVSTVGGLVKIT